MKAILLKTIIKGRQDQNVPREHLNSDARLVLIFNKVCDISKIICILFNF